MKSEKLKASANLNLTRNPERAKDIQKLYELMPSLSDEAILAVWTAGAELETKSLSI